MLRSYLKELTHSMLAYGPFLDSLYNSITDLNTQLAKTGLSTSHLKQLPEKDS